MSFLSGMGSLAGTAMVIGGVMTGNPALIVAGAGIGSVAANQETKESTKAQMDFQERMSNTAHRREMADLYAAGLNPTLSAKYGGASTPVGASYVAQNTAERASSSALQVKQLEQQNELIKWQSSNLQASTSNYGADTDKKEQERELLKEQVKTEQAKQLDYAASAKQLNTQSAINDANLHGLMNEAEIDQTTAGKVLRWINRISASVDGAREASGYRGHSTSTHYRGK